MPEMTDDEFAAFWDEQIEQAAKQAARDGDDSRVEELMIAQGEAYCARFPY